jgi:hypothetical protein
VNHARGGIQCLAARIWPPLGVRVGPFVGELAPARSVQHLYEFIYSGPLVDKIDYNKEKIAENIDRWLVAGGHVARLFPPQRAPALGG